SDPPTPTPGTSTKSSLQQGQTSIFRVERPSLLYSRLIFRVDKTNQKCVRRLAFSGKHTSTQYSYMKQLASTIGYTIASRLGFVQDLGLVCFSLRDDTGYSRIEIMLASGFNTSSRFR